MQWMRAGETGGGGEEALRRVRYPLMARECIRDQVRGLGAEVPALKELGVEALVYLKRAKEGRGGFEVRRMHPSALRRRSLV